MKVFTDRVAVVTGAASGIGAGMAEVFAAAGMKVVLSDIDTEALQQTTHTLRATGADVHAVATDVANADQVQELAHQTLSRYGAVHVLCNNAGVLSDGTPSWDLGLDQWRRIIDINLMGVIYGVRSFLPIMIEQDTEAHIVNTASLGGLIAAGVTPYETTKFAVVGLSENLHIELHRRGLKPKISVLCPGLVETNMAEEVRHGHTARDRGAAEHAPPESPEPLGPMSPRSPRAVAEQVLAAVNDESFYILTHPELNGFIEQRTRNILAGHNPPTR
jgi:NAD(P)-dependent dehydrogenase (short-subunit alcohol dehydrogenase family)